MGTFASSGVDLGERLEDLTTQCIYDGDCPQTICLAGAPCPFWICQNYRCKYTLKEPSDFCRIDNGTNCWRVNGTNNVDQGNFTAKEESCYYRFGICNFIDAKCRWEQRYDFLYCLYRLGEIINNFS